MVYDKTTRSIVPHDMNLYNFILDDLEHMDELTITIEHFVRIRELSQSNLFHKYVAEVAKFTGNTFKETKDALKLRYGARNEDGSIKSTTLHSTKEMGELIEGTYFIANTELLMNLPTPDEWRSNNLK